MGAGADFLEAITGFSVIGTIAKAVGLGASAVDTIRKIAPQLEDEVTVEITGQPGHEKQQLYFLALAAANGEVRKFSGFLGVAPTYGLLMIEFDQASNWIRVTLRYKVSGLAANAGQQVGSDADPSAWFDALALFRGPSCEVVGGAFDFTNTGLAGIPASSKSPDAPNGANGLPFVGQTILTPCPTVIPPNPAPIIQNPAPTAPKTNNGRPIPSPNPKPPGDNRSRGAVVVPGSSTPQSGGTSNLSGVGPCCPKTLALIPLVFASLSSPATNSDMRFNSPPVNPVTIG